MRKACGGLVDFDSVRPKYKTMPKLMSSYTNAIVNAIWGQGVLADKWLAFEVVRDGKDISERMPYSQRGIFKSKLLFLAYIDYQLSTKR